MRPRNFWNIERVEQEDKRISQTSLMLKDFYNILTGGLEFGDNFRGAVLNVDLVVGENAIVHNLAYVANNYIMLGSTVANQSLYDGVTQNTKTVIYIRATVSGSVRLLVF